MSNKRGDTLSPSQKASIVMELKTGGSTFKELAKKYRVDIGNINKIAKMNGIVGCTGKKQNPVHIENVKNENEIINETVEEKVASIVQPEIIDEITAKKEDTTSDHVVKTTINKSSKKSTSGHKKRAVLNDKIKLEIAAEIEDLLKNKKKNIRRETLCRKYNISSATLYRILKEYNIDIPRSKPKKKKTNKNSTISTKDLVIQIPDKKLVDNFKIEEHTTPDQVIIDRGGLNLLKIEKDNTVIRAGLIGKRHELPTDLVIFDDIDNESMFNFKKHEQTVKSFINEWIPFVNGVATKSLEVYVTGLTLAAITVTKICLEMNVNLTMLHFNLETGTYIPQVIKGDAPTYEMGSSKLYSWFVHDRRFGGLYCYKCSFKDIVKGTTFYVVRKNHYHTINSTQACKIENFVCTDLNDVWDVYALLVKEFLASGDKDPGKATISELTMDSNESIKFGECLSSYTNHINPSKRRKPYDDNQTMETEKEGN